MSRLVPAAVLMVMFFCGFTPVPVSFGPGGGSAPAPVPEPEKPAEKKDDRLDSTDMMIEMYASGEIKASWWVTLHEDPAAGQFWETSSESYGTTTTQRWQVVKVEGQRAIIEWQMKTESDYAVSNYVLAYLVKLGVEAGDVNVLQAWIGKPDKKAGDVEIMEKAEYAEDAETPSEDYETTEEEFSDLELAGGKWSGKVVTVKGEGFEVKTWTATDAWFGGVIKTELVGAEYVSELSAFGDDARPLLKWDDVELLKLMKKSADEDVQGKDIKDPPAKEDAKPDPKDDSPKKEEK